MRVYYVTATHQASPVDPSDHEELARMQGRQVRRARHELAKFFERAHAEEHATHVQAAPPAANMYPWTDVRVEEREESLESQHHAHGGEVGKPAERGT